MDKESLRDRFVLLEGTEQQIRSLHSPKILAAVHEQYGRYPPSPNIRIRP